MLSVHVGAKIADRNEIEAIKVPKRTATYAPLPYGDFIEMVLTGLNEFGYKVTGQEYAVSTETRGMAYGDQLFGVLTLEHANKDFQTCVGIRSSYDKSLSNGACIGNRVFVCDNMAFIGDMMVFRKHTVNMLDQSHGSLQGKLQSLLGSVPALIEYQDRQLQSYRAVELGRLQAHDFVVQAAQANVYSGEKILKVLKEFNEPRHPEFADRSLWSMINSVTELLKGSNIFNLQTRTNALYALATKFVEED